MIASDFILYMLAFFAGGLVLVWLIDWALGDDDDTWGAA